ncbi:tetratricopeptide repeat protein [Oceanospirillum sediminis]|uniref:Sel1 repeat family protein n=1 Tax=Oceanospirillum sediminis TaxID=2760088 RepID=A0A839IX96_9GAMM|nr:tetratricopeptide repeat protein [Oceanospirillum sediminis]MBB1489591.1 sel1 repeat family protein [Oceanospirillum sediminis]
MSAITMSFIRKIPLLLLLTSLSSNVLSESLTGSCDNIKEVKEIYKGASKNGLLCIDEIKNKNYDKALEICKIAGNKGDSWAQIHVGIIYQYGYGSTLKNDLEMAYWYEKAAKLNNPAGLTNMGVIYTLGLAGREPDKTEAIHWYNKARKAKHPRGIMNLGHLYQTGEEKDLVKAEELYLESAKLGYKPACKALQKLRARMHKHHNS